ncbi:MAG: hypothetical protein WA188_17540 [Terriglobales bacterium]
MLLVEEAPDFDFVFADAVGFIAVKFDKPYRTIAQAHRGQTLALAPVSFAVGPTQPPQVADPAALGDCLDMIDFGQYLEWHVKKRILLAWKSGAQFSHLVQHALA